MKVTVVGTSGGLSSFSYHSDHNDVVVKKRKHDSSWDIKKRKIGFQFHRPDHYDFGIHTSLLHDSFAKLTVDLKSTSVEHLDKIDTACALECAQPCVKFTTRNI